MVKKQEVTPEARALASEVGVKEEAVKGSGKGGKVLVEDVKEAAASAVPAEEASILIHVNPALIHADGGVVIGGKLYRNNSKVTPSEFDALKAYRSEPGAEHPQGLQLILKGAI